MMAASNCLLMNEKIFKAHYPGVKMSRIIFVFEHSVTGV